MANKNPFQNTFDEASKRYGLAPGTLSTFARIESGYNPNVTTGSYKGLFQLSNDQFRKYGGQGNIYDPVQNTSAGAAKIADLKSQFKRKFGRDPSLTELYMTHQQGFGGATAHLSNPSAPAWQNMYSTAEGRRKGPGWAKEAIWRNVPNDVKKRYGSVENMTSADFLNMWDQKVRRFSGQAAGTKSLSQPTGDVTTATGPEPPPGVIPPMTSDIATGSTNMAIKYQNAPGDPNSLMQGAQLDIGARRSKILADMLQKQSQQGKDVKHWLHGVSLPISALSASYMMGQEDKNTLGQRALYADDLASGDYSPMQRQLAMQGNKAALQTIAQQDSADRTFNRDRYYKGIDEERAHGRALELKKAALAEKEKQRIQDQADRKEMARYKQELKDGAKTGTIVQHPDVAQSAVLKYAEGDKKRIDAKADTTAMEILSDFEDRFAGVGKGWETMANYGLQFAAKGWDQMASIVGQKSPQDMKDAAIWWRKFKMFDELPLRHELFGATLTQGEKESWDSATIKPEMSAEMVRKAIEARREILIRGMTRAATDQLLYKGGRIVANTKLKLGLTPQQLAGMSNDEFAAHAAQVMQDRYGAKAPPAAPGAAAAPAAPAAPAQAAPAAPAPAAVPAELKTPKDFNIKDGQKVKGPDGKIYRANGGAWELVE